MFALSLLRTGFRPSMTAAVRAYSSDAGDGSDYESRSKTVHEKIKSTAKELQFHLDRVSSLHYRIKALGTISHVISHMATNDFLPIYQLNLPAIQSKHTAFMPLRRTCFDLDDALGQVNEFAFRRPGHGFRDFAITIINDENFRENPGGFIHAWKVVKNRFDDYEEIEDIVHLFFFYHLKLSKPKSS